MSHGAYLGLEGPLPFLGGLLGDAGIVTVLAWKGSGSLRSGLDHLLPWLPGEAPPRVYFETLK